MAEIAGRRFRKAFLELSGKDALIVDSAIAGLDIVSSGIVYGAFSNCGHWCSSVEHVYVPDNLADELIALVVEKTRPFEWVLAIHIRSTLVRSQISISSRLWTARLQSENVFGPVVAIY